MTIGLDIRTIADAIYARLVTDSAGSAARAYLGTSASMSTINGSTVAAFPIQLLESVQELGDVPYRWAAFDRGPILGAARYDMRSLPFDWWLYDAPDALTHNLESLAGALDQLYHRLDIAGGEASVDLITNPVPNVTGLTVMRVRILHTLWR